MAEKVYPKGIRCFNRNEKAPAFILGTIIMDVNEFREWIENDGREYFTDYQGKAQLKLTVMQSDRTGINLQVDNWKPNK